MASKRHRRAVACGDKIRHATQAQARYTCYLEKKRLDEWLIVYRCKFCRQWHIGHPPKNVRKAIETRYYG
jgi:hypothetical protein